MRNKQEAEGHKEQPPPEVQVTEVRFANEIERENRTHRERQYALQKSIKHATWCAFIAVSIYAGITGYQAYLTRKAIRNSEESFKKTLCQMQAQTAAMKELADASWLEAKGARAAVIVFSCGFNADELIFHASNGGQSIAENVTADILLTRRTWPSKKLVGAPLSFTVPPQPVNQLGFVWGNELEKKFSLQDISKKDWDAIRRGEQFITIELSGSYGNGFKETIKPAKTCQSYIFLSQLAWKNGTAINSTGGGLPEPHDCGRSFDIEMTAAMNARKEAQAKIKEQGKK